MHQEAPWRLLGRPGTPKLLVLVVDLASSSPLGISLAAPKAPLGSNLELLRPPSNVKLLILAPTCALTSQLSHEVGINLPSKVKFSSIPDPPNLDFFNTLQCFSISTIHFKCALKASILLPSSPKMTPRCSQDPPKSL